MVADRQAFDALAGLLEYPRAEYAQKAQAARAVVGATSPEAGEELQALESGLSGLQLWEIEELFTRTFDLNPKCCPEIGWHLFGERYDRGSLLVWMRSQLREHGLAENEELPDHVAHALRLLPRLEAGPAKQLAIHAVGPALTTMVGILAHETTPFRHAVRAARAAVVDTYGQPVERTGTGPTGPIDLSGPAPKE